MIKSGNVTKLFKSFREAIKKKKSKIFHTLGLDPHPQECDNSQPNFLKEKLPRTRPILRKKVWKISHLFFYFYGFP